MTDIENRRLAIEQDEPPIYRVVDTLCHNEMLRRMNRENEQILVPVWMRITAPIADFGFYTLKTLKQS